MKQYLYVVSTGSGLCKVGIAKDLEKRRRTLERGCGYPLAMALALGPFNAAKRLEVAVHKALFAHRKEGEWFACDVSVAVACVQQAHIAFVDAPDETEEERRMHAQALDELIGQMLAPQRKRVERAERELAALNAITALVSKYPMRPRASMHASPAERSALEAIAQPSLLTH